MSNPQQIIVPCPNCGCGVIAPTGECARCYLVEQGGQYRNPSIARVTTQGVGQEACWLSANPWTKSVYPADLGGTFDMLFQGFGTLAFGTGCTYSRSLSLPGVATIQGGHPAGCPGSSLGTIGLTSMTRTLSLQLDLLNNNGRYRYEYRVVGVDQFGGSLTQFIQRSEGNGAVSNPISLANTGLINFTQSSTATIQFLGATAQPCT